MQTVGAALPLPMHAANLVDGRTPLPSHQAAGPPRRVTPEPVLAPNNNIPASDKVMDLGADYPAVGDPKYQARAWVFTAFNFEEEERLEAFKKFAQEFCRRALVAQEVCPTTGRPHLQGTFTCRKPVRRSFILNQLWPMALYKRNGTEKQAEDYCRKGEQPKAEWLEHKTAGRSHGLNAVIWFELGENASQGKRSDLNGVTSFCINRLAEEGRCSQRDIAENYPEMFVRYERGLNRLLEVMTDPYKGKREVIVHYGATGTGKTYNALNMFETCYVATPNMYGQQQAWFNGYTGQAQVVIEEFRGQLRFGDLLVLLDSTPSKVNIKNGDAWWQAEQIVITSPVHPSQWYQSIDQKVEGSTAQLRRRISKVINYGNRKGTPNMNPVDVTADDALWGEEEPTPMDLGDQFAAEPPPLARQHAFGA